MPASPVTDLPTWHPPQQVLELAELVLLGVLDRFPVPVDLPDELAGVPAVVLQDAEGTPVARLSLVGLDDRGAREPEEGRAQDPGTGRAEVLGVEPLRAFTHGPLRRPRRTPEQVRGAFAEAAGKGLIVVPVESLLPVAVVEEVRARAVESGRAVLWLAVLGAGRPSALPPAGLWRAVRDLAEEDAGTAQLAVPVAVPRIEGPGDARADVAMIERVAAGYGAAEVITPPAGGQERDGGFHPAFERERERAAPPPHRRGVTVFFTGLSGSGKSTVAKALAEEIVETGARTVSLLDGDEVRRMLSAGLGFSRADRDLNIRRIGFVAAEVTRHGGLAICAPIAPFAATREAVRADVEAVGDFVLVHVATPLEECERRDRKGLYARARQGLIADFTGISSPYEEPADADLRVDTSDLDVAEAVALVRDLLAARGYLPASS